MEKGEEDEENEKKDDVENEKVDDAENESGEKEVDGENGEYEVNGEDKENENMVHIPTRAEVIVASYEKNDAKLNEHNAMLKYDMDSREKEEIQEFVAQITKAASGIACLACVSLSRIHSNHSLVTTTEEDQIAFDEAVTKLGGMFIGKSLDKKEDLLASDIGKSYHDLLDTYYPLLKKGADANNGKLPGKDA
jgi:hypothetical protein